MQVADGFVRAQAPDGREWTFSPALGRISGLGSPEEIVELYAGLFGTRAGEDARFVLCALCDQDEPFPLVGWRDDAGVVRDGLMPEGELVIIARHLMRHGIAGEARPGGGDGQYAKRFEAADFIAAARAHLGLSSADAAALSMTELQRMMRMKFPEQEGQKGAAPDIRTREQYEAAVAAIEKARASAKARRDGKEKGDG